VELPAFIATSALLTLMPGPDILYVLTTGLTRGRRPALAVSLGLASGLLVHTTAAALGLSLVVSRSPVLLQTIRYAGVAYLLYLGFKALRSGRELRCCRSGGAQSLTSDTLPRTPRPASAEQREEQREEKNKKIGSLYRIGVTMNLLNPKVILFFLALFPQFLSPESATPRADIFLLGAIFAVQAAVIFSTVSVLSGWLGDRFSAGRLSPRVVGRINAIVYGALALVFLFA
jgi:threonine/homoserine/homoserine lactone efflux protein